MHVIKSPSLFSELSLIDQPQLYFKEFTKGQVYQMVLFLAYISWIFSHNIEYLF